MARVNPPAQKIPDLENKELFKFLQEQSFFLYQLWKRTGGGDDTINEVVSTESYETSISTGEMHQLLEGMENETKTVETKVFTVLEVATNYTATNLDYIETAGNLTIYLDENADVNDEIIIANGDGGKVTVDALSSTINYMKSDQKLEMLRKGTSLHFHRFSDHWRIQ